MMPFSFLDIPPLEIMSISDIPQFVDVDTTYFAVSTLLIVLLLQIVVGLCARKVPVAPPFMWWLSHRMIKTLDMKLNRQNRTAGALRVRGLIAIAVMGFMAWGVAKFIYTMTHVYPFGWLLIPFVLWASIDVKTPWRVLKVFSKCKMAAGVQAYAQGLHTVTDLDFKDADFHTVLRHVVLYAGYGLVRYFVAPTLCFILFGLTGLVFYIFLTVSAEHVDFMLSERRPFYTLQHKLRAIVDFVPVWGAVMVTVLASLLVTKVKTLHVFAYPLSTEVKAVGRMRAIFAAYSAVCWGALGGAIRYADRAPVNMPWVGPHGAQARLEITDLKRVYRVYRLSVFLILFGLVLFLRSLRSF